MTEEAQSSWWSNTTGEWERDADYQVDIEFKAEDAELFGFYKKHRRSSSEIASTAINSQRKIAQEAETGDGAYTRFHHVYESDGKIYYTWSEDDNSSWEGEVLLSEFDHHCFHPMLDVSQNNATLDYVIHVAFVDDTLDAVIVLSRDFDARPTDWTKVDEISVSHPSACHPSLGTLAYDGHHFTFLAWEDGLNMKYSVFEDDDVLTGDRVETTGTTSNVDFDGLTLTSVNAYSELKYPSVCRHSDTQYSYSDFGVVWSEQFSRSGPTKLLFNGLRIGKSGSTYTVSEADPIDAAGTKDIRYNTGASISIHPAFPRISYEYNSYSTYPAPSSGSSWPRVIAGRSFFAITSQYPGYGITRQQYYSRVVAKNADDFCYEAVSWPYVVHTMNIPSPNSDVRAPVIDHCWDAGGNGNIKVVANWDLTAPLYTVWTYFDRWSWQSPAMQVMINDGLYPQVSANNHDQNKGLSIFSDPQRSISPAGASSRVNGVDIEYQMHSTTTGIRKENGTVTTDEMREFSFAANDSAVVVYGVATPHYVLDDTTYTDVDWDMSYDTIPYLWWNQLRHGMKTESFTVPTGAEMEFGNELFADNAGDFASGGSFRIRIEFREATEDTICYSEMIDMSNYSLDSSEYVLDRIDISSLAGKDVFMCFNPIDSISTCDFDVAYVVTVYHQETEKRTAATNPTPDVIHLGQNFPNPFNPSTQIPYELETNTHVKIDVYDIFGRRISRIQDGIKRAGMHVASFDATGLPSGVYMYRIEALGRTLTKKMHFVK